MFGLGKKKKEDVYAAVTGVLIPLTEVSDPVLAQKMMGDGFAIKPKNGEIYAPVDGNITMIFLPSMLFQLRLFKGLKCLFTWDSIRLRWMAGHLMSGYRGIKK